MSVASLWRGRVCKSNDSGGKNNSGAIHLIVPFPLALESCVKVVVSVSVIQERPKSAKQARLEQVIRTLTWVEINSRGSSINVQCSLLSDHHEQYLVFDYEDALDPGPHPVPMKISISCVLNIFAIKLTKWTQYVSGCCCKNSTTFPFSIHGAVRHSLRVLPSRR